MFNKQKFNSEKFNTASGAGGPELTGILSMKIGTSGSLNVRKVAEGRIDLVLLADGQFCRQLKAVPGDMEAALFAFGDGRRMIGGLLGEFDLCMEANADRFNAYGTEYMDLAGLQIRPGGELKIDTEEMTIELDGQNVIDFLSVDSEFFFLRPGENTIVYKDGNGTRNAQIRILWKDRWL